MPTSPAERNLAPARSYGRGEGDIRPVRLTRSVLPHALGSCEVEFGQTKVLCAATIEDGLPAWRRASRCGWVTAEYAMLPASTNRRTNREIVELQGTGERTPFDRQRLNRLLDLGDTGIAKLVALQNEVTGFRD